MFTIFHFSRLLGKIFGLTWGAGWGYHWLGLSGGILGGLVGFTVGHMLGTLPEVIVLKLVLRDLRKTDSASLRSWLESEYFIAHLIIGELIVRGEPMESFRDYVTRLRNSDSPDRKRLGEHITRIWPEIMVTSGRGTESQSTN